MGFNCCIPKCSSRTGSRGSTTRISLHSFPSDTTLWNKWVAAIQMNVGKHFRCKKSTKICSKHFLETDLKRGPGFTAVKHGAIPSIFDPDILPKKRKLSPQEAETKVEMDFIAEFQGVEIKQPKVYLTRVELPGTLEDSQRTKSADSVLDNKDSSQLEVTRDEMFGLQKLDTADPVDNHENLPSLELTCDMNNMSTHENFADELLKLQQLGTTDLDLDTNGILPPIGLSCDLGMESAVAAPEDEMLDSTEKIGTADLEPNYTDNLPPIGLTCDINTESTDEQLAHNMLNLQQLETINLDPEPIGNLPPIALTCDVNTQHLEVESFNLQKQKTGMTEQNNNKNSSALEATDTNNVSHTDKPANQQSFEFIDLTQESPSITNQVPNGSQIKEIDIPSRERSSKRSYSQCEDSSIVTSTPSKHPRLGEVSSSSEILQNLENALSNGSSEVADDQVVIYVSLPKKVLKDHLKTDSVRNQTTQCEYIDIVKEQLNKFGDEFLDTFSVPDISSKTNPTGSADSTIESDDFNNPQKFRKFCEIASSTIERQKKKIDSLKAKNSQLEKKVKKLKSFVFLLQNANKIPDDCQVLLLEV